MRPTLLLWLVGLLVVFVGVGLAIRLRDIWHDGRAFRQIKQRFDFLGEPYATSLVSTLPVDIPYVISAGVLVLLIMARESNAFGLRSIIESTSYFFVPVFLLLQLLFFSVLLFGRPKFIIPPHLREHRGVVPEYIRSTVAWVSTQFEHLSARAKKP